jgi:hypothetical protein
MPPELPTFPTILAEAGRFSINDLAIMSPGEMSPEAELAYIAELRAYRERYERALGVKKEGRATKGSKTAKVLNVTFEDGGGEGELF